MSCPSCGSPTVPDARFCFACGAALPGTLDVEAERRVVTVLFGDLSDFTSWSEDLDPERVGGLTDRVLATLAAAVQEFGGSLAAPGWGDIADWWHRVRAQPATHAAARSVQRRFAFLDDLVADVPPGAVRRAAATIAKLSDV